MISTKESFQKILIYHANVEVLVGLFAITSGSVIEVPQSQNVSVGEMVVLACATTNVGDGIAWVIVPPTPSDINIEIVGGGKCSVLKFTAFFNQMVHCIVTDTSLHKKISKKKSS